MHTDSDQSNGLEETIAQLVSAAMGKPAADVRANGKLLNPAEGFDSFALLELVLRIEDAFGISIPDDDLDLSHFESISSIAAYVRSRIGTASAT